MQNLTRHEHLQLHFCRKKYFNSNNRSFLCPINKLTYRNYYGKPIIRPTMGVATQILNILQIAYHAKIVSAHRTPQRMVDFAKSARDSGYKVIIAGAGGAAHLPGMTAAFTSLPVLGVPIKSKT